MQIILLILLAMAIIIVGPMITIWALNTLFLFQIPLNVATWFATFWLSAMLTAVKVKR